MIRVKQRSSVSPVEPNSGNSSRNMSTFALVSQYHANAIECQTTNVVIDFPAMAAVSKACSTIFALVDRDDSHQRAAARDVWLVKTSLTHTALPFGDTRLGLDGLLDSLGQVANSVPGLQPPVQDLTVLVRQLMAADLNPKRDRLLELLRRSDTNETRVGILANLCGSLTPGWPPSIETGRDLGASEVELIRTRRQAKSSVFARLIIPGNSWFAPRGLLFDLVYGGRTSDIVVVAYQTERASLPAPKRLPKDSVLSTQRQSPRRSLSATVELGVESRLDQWAINSFWSSIHSQHGDIAPASDRDITVDANFVLFADGSGAFLPVDRRVVEVSELFESGADFDVTEDRLPRTLVRDLEDGDLVMLRLSGSGDYLDDVADSLIERAGETGLRARALEWKDRLHRVIKRYGEGVVAKRIRGLGVPLRSPQYLWAWAGDAVMAPHDRHTFRRLVEAIHMLETPAVSEDSETYADAKWDDMERLKAYHLKAGVAIRVALLARVRSLVSERRRIDTVQSIELPGVAAGKMGLLRVAAVDSATRKVPLSKLFHLGKVKVT